MRIQEEEVKRWVNGGGDAKVLTNSTIGCTSLMDLAPCTSSSCDT
jgi:hypothetical protein